MGVPVAHVYWVKYSQGQYSFNKGYEKKEKEKRVMVRIWFKLIKRRENIPIQNFFRCTWPEGQICTWHMAKIFSDACGQNSRKNDLQEMNYGVVNVDMAHSFRGMQVVKIRPATSNRSTEIFCVKFQLQNSPLKRLSSDIILFS